MEEKKKTEEKKQTEEKKKMYLGHLKEETAEKKPPRK